MKRTRAKRPRPSPRCAIHILAVWAVAKASPKLSRLLDSANGFRLHLRYNIFGLVIAPLPGRIKRRERADPSHFRSQPGAGHPSVELQSSLFHPSSLVGDVLLKTFPGLFGNPGRIRKMSQSGYALYRILLYFIQGADP